MAKKKAPQPEVAAPEKGKAGRPPRYELHSEEFYEKIRELASMGMYDKNIAYCLGYSAEWFAKLKKEHPQIVQALKEGNAEGEQRAVRSLMQEVEARNMTGIIFYLKAKHGWRENDAVVPDGADGNTGLASRRVLERVRKAKQ